MCVYIYASVVVCECVSALLLCVPVYSSHLFLLVSVPVHVCMHRLMSLCVMVRMAQVTAGLRKALSTTRFRDAPIVPVAAAAGARPEGADAHAIANLTTGLVQALRRPRRTDDGHFLMAVDHWYACLCVA